METVTCTQCGKQMTAGTKFCTGCGSALPTAPAPAAYAPAPAPEVVTAAAPTPVPVATPAPVATSSGGASSGGTAGDGGGGSSRGTGAYGSSYYSGWPGIDIAPPEHSKYSVLSTGGVLGSLILMSLPVVGWIIMLVWVCGGNKKQARINLARGMLLYTILTSFLAFILVLVLVVTGVFAAASADIRSGDWWWDADVIQVSEQPVASPGVSSSPAPSSALANVTAPPGWGSGGGFGGTGDIAQNYAELLSAKQYYMSFSMDALGMTTTGIFAQSGNRSVAIAEILGFESYELYDGNNCYTIYRDHEVYTVDTVSGGNSGGLAESFAEMEYVGQGEGKVNGVVCAYDEYVDGNDDDVTYRFYTEDGALRGIGVVESSLEMEMMMVIDAFSEEIPAGLLEIPAGFREVDEDEAAELLY